MKLFVPLLAAAFAVLVILDLAWLHPGFSIIDEAYVVRYAWEWIRYAHGEASLMTGFFSTGSIALSMALFPGLMGLHVPALFCLALECVLLWKLAERFHGRPAAWGAVAFNLACALTLSRARSLLSFAILPCELLIVIHLALGKRPWQPLLGGFLAGVFSLDYEGWLWGGWPALCAFLFFLRRSGEPLAVKPLLLGWALGGLLALGISYDNLLAYIELRTAFTLKQQGPTGQWFLGLKGLFIGGEVLPGLGGAWMHPTLPYWSWPLLALGIFSATKPKSPLLFWAAAGLPLLALPSAGLNESNRAIAAWPALCMLSGLGLARLLPATGWRRALLFSWIALGALWEAKAFLKSQDHYDAEYYSKSRAMLAAADWVKAEAAKGPVKVLSNLGSRKMSEFEWMCRGAETTENVPGLRVVAPLEWMALPALHGVEAKTLSFEGPGGGQDFSLSELSGRPAQSLEQADRFLGQAWLKLPRFNHIESKRRLWDWLSRPDLAHPWVRTSLWERLMITATTLGRVEPKVLEGLKKEKLLHAGPLYHTAGYLLPHDPALAAELYAQALKMDPRLRNFDRDGK